jgi:hypothetical protein
MLPINYKYTSYSRVADIADFFKSTLPEMHKLKALHNSLKLLFKVTNADIIVECSDVGRIYKFTLMSTGVNKYPIGEFYYLPQNKQLDLWDLSKPQMPLIQWKGKKAVFKNYSLLLDKVEMEKLFQKITNVI